MADANLLRWFYNPTVGGDSWFKPKSCPYLISFKKEVLGMIQKQNRIIKTPKVDNHFQGRS